MRHGTTNNRRQRNRSNGGRPQNQSRTQVYDSNGPDVRIRGTAHQVAEKYLALAKDSHSMGDRIMSESYYQHAEHYIRIINEMNGTFDMSRVSEPEMSGNEMYEDDNKKEVSVQKPVHVQVRDDLSLPASIIGAPISQARESEIAE